MLTALTVFSALSFMGYGLGCVFTQHMVAEFERFGLARFRVIVGVTQLAGAIGLGLGFLEPWLAVLASGGLALQMLLGVGTRVVIRDTVLQTFPATFYCLLNAYLCVAWTERLAA